MIHLVSLVFAAAAFVSNVAGLVNPFAGTGGTTGVGLIDDFPGASAPFGMVQWSPDTPSMPPSGGYLYRDTAITGFSVNHLSGAGCPIFGDFAMLPTVGDIGNPQSAQIPFSHENEEATPGYYAVTLGNGVRVQLAATARTGFGRFVFPSTSRANVTINTSSDQSGIAFSEFHVVAADEVVGAVHSGGFCGQPNQFQAYVAIRFDRPFSSFGTWQGTSLSPGSKDVSGGRSGGWVTFDTTQTSTVNVRVALSYTSVEEAMKNLATASEPDLEHARSASGEAWQRLLSEVRVSGGSESDRRMLYTSLYHAMLSPTLYSDADGSYLGFDGAVHHDAKGHAEYTNFSSWDIYRTQIPLIALLAPHETSDMMQSLVHMGQQGGWVPNWPVANGYTGEMGGDSSAPIIAQAYAFGARDFDTRAALGALIKNASDLSSVPGQGWYQARPALDEYLRNGYVSNTHTTNGSPVTHGASVTLEYSIDDFSIAQFARSLHRMDVYNTFAERGMNWKNVFDTSNGTIAARDDEGAFVNAPITSIGQSGFQEGNAAQYTWMVPQSMSALVKQMGGDAVTIAKLDTFFTQLNAGWEQPYAWFGNEPSFNAPWTYLYAGAPFKAEAVNRKVLLTLYAPTPDGYPGNDDLGTMSSWWIWNAIGLYPLTPGTPVLLAQPSLFTHVSIHSPSGQTIEINAPNASDAAAYFATLRINGVGTNRSWVTLPSRGRLALDEGVSAQPNPRFGSSANDRPPSYEYGDMHFPPSSRVALTVPATTIDTRAGGHAQLDVSFSNGAALPVALTWQAQVPNGLALTPAQGTVRIDGSKPDALDPTLTIDGSAAPGLYDIPIRAKTAEGATLARATAIVRVSPASGTLPLAYVANANDNTILPFDPRTHAFGNPIATGTTPSDLAVSNDGTRVYVANQGDNTVSILNAVSGKAVADVKVGTGPSGVRLSRDGKTAWVANTGDNTVQAIETATLQSGLPIAVGISPSKLAIAPDGSAVYVADQGGGDITVIDTATKRVTGHIAAAMLPLGVAFSPDGSRAYVSDAATSSVSIVDTKRAAVVGQIQVGVVPQGLAVSPDGSLVYVADSASSQVTPIDATSGKALAPIAVGNLPVAVGFARDGKTAFVVTSGDNFCVVIDVASGKVIDRIRTGNGPSGLALP